MRTAQRRLYVAGFLHAADCVLLVQKAKPEWQKGKWNGIGGKVEEGEPPLAAMVREFREETGLDTLPAEWVHCVTLDGGSFSVMFFAAHWERTDALSLMLTPEPDEPVAWVPRTAWWEWPVVPNLRWLLPLTHPQGKGMRADWPLYVAENRG